MGPEASRGVGAGRGGSQHRRVRAGDDDRCRRSRRRSPGSRPRRSCCRRRRRGTAARRHRAAARHQPRGVGVRSRPRARGAGPPLLARLARRARHRTEDAAALGAGGALLRYLAELQPAGLPHLHRPVVRRSEAYLWLDDMTRRNLELVEPLRAGAPGCTLLETIDATVTPMGGRLLRRWLLSPLRDPAAIDARLDAVDVAVRDSRGRARLREALDGVRDLERLAGRAAAGRAVPRELGALRDSFQRLPGRGRGAERGRGVRTARRAARRAAGRGGRGARSPRRPHRRPHRGAGGSPAADAGRRRRHPSRATTPSSTSCARCATAAGSYIAVAPAAGARAHRHHLAEGRLQQGLRVLPGDHQRALGPGPRRLRAPADARLRRALRDARAQGIRVEGAGRGGADGRRARPSCSRRSAAP